MTTLDCVQLKDNNHAVVAKSGPEISSQAYQLLLSNYNQKIINLLTPNVNYCGCTTPLTSEVTFYIFIQQI